MVKLSKVERDALDELFAGLESNRPSMLEKIIRFIRRHF